MRQKRAKTYRKLMNLYSQSFGFRLPYQVLVHSDMCEEAVDHKVELFKQIGVVLQGDIKLMITQCCIHELYLKGKEKQPAVDLAKTFERRKCNHREAIPGDECILSVIGENNKHRYVVSAQSQALRSKLRGIPGVPIIHINRTVMVLEPPSDATQRRKALLETKEMQAKGADLALANQSKPKESPRVLTKRQQGPKGPNPLSMKKKKKDGEEPTAKAGTKRKAEDSEEQPSSRKRKRRSKHPPESEQQDTLTSNDTGPLN